MDSEPTVFVVDDDAAVRNAISLLMKSAGLAVESYPSASEFLAQYDPSRPGCLVLDVRMPGMSGPDLQEALASRHIHIPIIVVTGHGDVPMAVRAIRRGALDFLQKPFDDHVLLQRIEQALALDARRREEEAHQAEVQGRLGRLTQREREVMELLIAGRGNKEIAFDLGLSRKTVDIHRSHIMMKLGLDSLAELVRLGLALQAGERSTPTP